MQWSDDAAGMQPVHIKIISSGWRCVQTKRSGIGKYVCNICHYVNEGTYMLTPTRNSLLSRSLTLTLTHTHSYTHTSYIHKYLDDVFLNIGMVADSNYFLQGYNVSTFVGLDEAKAATMKDRPTHFIVVRPGLANAAGSVSLMSFEKPGWYLRHYNSRLYLEPKTNPRNPQLFDSDASFTEHLNSFYDGYVSFESVNYPGSYITQQGTQGMYIRHVDGTSDFKQSASFAAVSATNRRKKRESSYGKIDCLFSTGTR